MVECVLVANAPERRRRGLPNQMNIGIGLLVVQEQDEVVIEVPGTDHVKDSAAKRVFPDLIQLPRQFPFDIQPVSFAEDLSPLVAPGYSHAVKEDTTAGPFMESTNPAACNAVPFAR